MADPDVQLEAIDVERLEGWDATSPPAGFADRVTAAWLDERHAVGSSRVSRTRAVAAVAVALAMVLGLAFAWTATRSATARGQLSADARASLDIGERAVAVAEAGAELRWRVAADGSTQVEQSRGAVFYRVENGGPFEVTTPHGSVRVTGTCFTVEIEDMNRSGYVKAGALGAVLAAGVVVSVYEGGVVLARDGREVALAAGERGRADAAGPRRSSGEEDAASTSVDDAALATADPGELAARLRSQAREVDRLRSTESEQRAEIARLQKQVQALGGAAPADALGKAKRCAEGSREDEGCSFVDPDQETLVEMARCSTVTADIPGFLFDAENAATLSPDWMKKAGVGADEAAALTEIGETFRNEYTEGLAKLYAEAGGDAELADGMPSRPLEAMIEPLLGKDDVQRARGQLSRERAGLVDPLEPSAMSLADRYVRQITDVGNRFEAKVAEAFGAERAHALRVVDDGWPGGTAVHGGECEP